jgi:hypothetical protein
MRQNLIVGDKVEIRYKPGRRYDPISEFHFSGDYKDLEKVGIAKWSELYNRTAEVVSKYDGGTSFWNISLDDFDDVVIPFGDNHLRKIGDAEPVNYVKGRKVFDFWPNKT